MTFNEWWPTISFEARRNFVEMSAFALKKIAEMAWNKSREETLKETKIKEVEKMNNWILTSRVKQVSLPDDEEIYNLEKGE
jgi:hypothetical protein